MTTVYVNGKRVTKEELSKYKVFLDLEKTERILAEKLTKNKR